MTSALGMGFARDAFHPPGGSGKGSALFIRVHAPIYP